MLEDLKRELVVSREADAAAIEELAEVRMRKVMPHGTCRDTHNPKP